MEKIAKIIGVVSGVLGICDFIWGYIRENKIAISPTRIVFFVLCVIFLVLSYIFSNSRRTHDFYRYISYFFHKMGAKCIVLDWNAEYIYINRTELQLHRTKNLKSCVKGLNSYDEEFLWTHWQPLDSYKEKVKCLSKHNSLELKMREMWVDYTIGFDPPPKHGKMLVEIAIAPLLDPDKKALPVFGMCIDEPIKKFKMSVVFGDVKVKDFRYSIYDNTIARNPIYQENYGDVVAKPHLKYSHDTKTLTVEEKFPIYGYGYRVEWDFDE